MNTLRARISRAVLKRTATEITYPEPDRVELHMSQYESQMLKTIVQFYADYADHSRTGDTADRLQFSEWLVRKL